MKKLSLLASALVAFATFDAAVAAPPQPVYNWTGYYLGINGGYDAGRDPFSMSTVSGTAYPGGLPVGTPLYTNYPTGTNILAQGWFGGGQAGYNYEFASRWVGGIEADFQGGDMSGTVSCILACGTRLTIVNAPLPTNTARVTFSNISAQDKLDWFGTVRGRFGYTGDTPAWVYVTGGLAYGSVERNGQVAGTSTSAGGGTTYNTFAGSFDNTSTRVGWTIGLGVEDRLTTNWSLKLEYLYIDLGSSTDTFSTYYKTVNCGGCGTVGGQAGVRTDSTSFHESVARVGLNYKFGG